MQFTNEEILNEFEKVYEIRFTKKYGKIEGIKKLFQELPFNPFLEALGYNEEKYPKPKQLILLNHNCMFLSQPKDPRESEFFFKPEYLFEDEYVDSKKVIKDLKIITLEQKEVSTLMPESKFSVRIQLQNGNFVNLMELKDEKGIFDTSYFEPKEWFNLFGIGIVEGNNYLINHELMVLGLTSNADSFQFNKIRHSICNYNCGNRKCEHKSKKILFVADFNGNLAFEGEIFTKLYAYNERYMIGITFDHRILLLNMQNRCIVHELNVNIIAATLSEIFLTYFECGDKYFWEFTTKLISPSIANKNLIVAGETKENKTFFGVFDLEKNKWVISPRYQFVYFVEEYIIALEGKKQIVFSLKGKKIGKVDVDMQMFVKKVIKNYVILQNISGNYRKDSIRILNTSEELLPELDFQCVKFGLNRYILLRFYANIENWHNSEGDYIEILDLQEQRYIISGKFINEPEQKVDIETIFSQQTRKIYDTSVCDIISMNKVMFHSHDNMDYIILNLKNKCMLITVIKNQYRCRILDYNYIMAIVSHFAMTSIKDKYCIVDIENGKIVIDDINIKII